MTDGQIARGFAPGVEREPAACTLTVVGSCNVDCVARTRRLPRPGETLLATEFTRTTGGKGANQAVAAARLGLSVSLVSAVGDDDFGREIIERLTGEGVDVTHVRRLGGPSGVALITVDDDGENTIVVGQGANGRVSVADVDLSTPQAVLAQLEIPIDVVAEAARRTSGLFCLNASPFTPLPDSLWSGCDLIIVNETEYALGREQLDETRLVCVTLGAAGARLLQDGREVAAARSTEVEAVDTVGAGDAFVAALVGEILRTGDPAASLPVACRAGAVATTRLGAQAALPFREELV